jgi:ATP-binding cassette subfamily F protein 3
VFPGTVLLVSHDRALVDAVAQRTLAIEDGALHSYDGGWAEYVRRRDELAEAAKPAPVVKPARERRRPPQVAAAAPRPSELESLEAEITDREEAVAELERRLADDWTNADALAEHRQARQELQSRAEHALRQLGVRVAHRSSGAIVRPCPESCCQ